MLSLQVDCISTPKHEKIFGNVAIIGHDELSSIWIMTNGKRQGGFKCQASHLLLYHCLLTTPSKKKVIVLWNINTSTSPRLTPNFNFWNGQTIISFFCSGQRKWNWGALIAVFQLTKESQPRKTYHLNFTSNIWIMLVMLALSWLFLILLKVVNNYLTVLEVKYN